MTLYFIIIDWPMHKKFFFLNLSHSILCTKKMIFCIFNLGTFYGVVATFFDEVARYEMTGKSITKKGPETAQSDREVDPV